MRPAAFNNLIFCSIGVRSSSPLLISVTNNPRSSRIRGHWGEVVHHRSDNTAEPMTVS